MAKQDIQSRVNFVKASSDLSVIYQRKCKEWQKGGSLVTD
jgi:hypothetical protein